VTAGQEDDEQDQGWCQEAIDDCRPKQHFYRVKSGEIQWEAQHHGYGHHSVELARAS